MLFHISKDEPITLESRLTFGSCTHSHSFGHNSKLMPTGQGWNIDGLVNEESSLQAHHCDNTHYHGCITSPHVDLMLHLTFTSEQDPELFRLDLPRSRISVITLNNSVIFTDRNDCQIHEK